MIVRDGVVSRHLHCQIMGRVLGCVVVGPVAATMVSLFYSFGVCMVIFCLWPDPNNRCHERVFVSLLCKKVGVYGYVPTPGYMERRCVFVSTYRIFTLLCFDRMYFVGNIAQQISGL